MAVGLESDRDRVAAGIRIAGVPLRLEIMCRLAEQGSLSPSQFAQSGAASLRESAYHFRYLRDGGLILLENVETGGGTAQHFYRLSPLGRALVDALPKLESAMRRQSAGKGRRFGTRSTSGRA